MAGKPYSMEILLEHICYSGLYKSMDTSQSVVPDILKFNAFATLNLTKPYLDTKYIITDKNRRKKLPGKIRLR